MKVFYDLIETIGKVFKGLLTLTKEERKKYLAVLAETCQLLDSTLNLVIFRITTLLGESDEAKFIQETKEIAYYDKWLAAERNMYLCHNLRATLRDAKTFFGTIKGDLAAFDYDSMVAQMEGMLGMESDLARFISGKLANIAYDAENNANKPQAELITDLKKTLADFRQAINAERKKVIALELAIHADI